MYDAVAISDLHLGSDNCQARQLVQFLEAVRNGDLPTRRLILNGDVFDSIDFRRLKKHHWKVLSLLRKLTDEIEVLWLIGNHDGPTDLISPLLGVTVADEVVIESGGRRVLILHGHRFDSFLSRFPLVTRVADALYNLLQWVDPSHTVARFAKKNSKTFLRCAAKIENRSIEYAARKGCDAVCCGHTHHATARTGGEVEYFNHGCWTERPCHYLTLRDGVIEVRTIAEEVEHVPAERVRLAPVPSVA